MVLPETICAIATVLPQPIHGVTSRFNLGKTLSDCFDNLGFTLVLVVRQNCGEEHNTREF